MRRPLLVVALAYFAGLAFGYFSFQKHISVLLVCSIIIAIVLVISIIFAQKRWLFICVSTVLLLGTILFSLTANQIRKCSPYPPNTRFSGTVVEVQALQGQRDKLVLSDVRTGSNQSVLGYVHLNAPHRNYLIGQIVIFTANLKPIQGYDNPGVIDRRLIMAQNNVFYQGDAISIHQTHKIVENLTVLAGRLRFHATQTGQSIFGKNAALVNSLILGDKQNVPPEVKESFSVTGLAHIMAASGMNIGFLLLLFMALWRIFPILPRILLPSVFTILISLYCVMTGLALPCVRAAIMSLVVIWAVPLRRKSDALSMIAFCFLVITLKNPLSILSAGFQLSMSAIIGLAIFEAPLSSFLRNYMPKWTVPIISEFSTVVSATLGILPFLAYWFSTVPVLGIFANVVIVPLVAVVLYLGMPALILGMFGAPSILGIPASIITGILQDGINILARIPLMQIHVISPGWWGFASYAAILFMSSSLIWMRFRRKMKVILCCLVISIFGFGLSSIWQNNTVQFTVLDVGQGQCLVIRTHHGDYLIDAGGSILGPDPGRFAIIPSLRQMGVSKLNGIIITHPHLDHILAINEIAKQIPVQRIFAPVGVGKNQHIPMQPLSLDVGQTIQMDKSASFTITFEKDQMMAGVLEFYGKKILITSDLSDKQLMNMLAKDDKNRYDWLILPHHGSHTGMSDQVLRLIKPKAALISCGRFNEYGHPSPSVVRMINAACIPLYRTDEQGAFSLKKSFGIWFYNLAQWKEATT